LQLVRDLNDAIIPPLREFRAAVVENGMAFRVNIEQALRLHPRGNFASDVIVDLMARRPLNEQLPTSGATGNGRIMQTPFCQQGTVAAAAVRFRFGYFEAVSPAEMWPNGN